MSGQRGPGRRALLAGVAALLLPGPVRAISISGGLPWSPNAGHPPQEVSPGGWHYFTPEEGAAVEAIVDRLIPPDDRVPGGKDAGCAVFIDRQLAGPFGSSRGLYMRPPFVDSAPPEFGLQSSVTPAQLYRAGLAGLDTHCRVAFAGQAFRALSAEQQDRLLSVLETGKLDLQGANGRRFFAQILANTKEGFFADPVYGGNRDMAGWKMIGFAGARYDFRDWVDRHNERYPLPPVGITGRPEWTKG